jgi:hypothetical protein
MKTTNPHRLQGTSTSCGRRDEGPRARPTQCSCIGYRSAGNARVHKWYISAENAFIRTRSAFVRIPLPSEIIDMVVSWAGTTVGGLTREERERLSQARVRR